MSKVDWSLAPEGATHKDFTERGLWYKFDYDANTVHYWSDRKGGYWCLSGIPDQYSDGSMDDMEAKSKPWSGPEDGLPPTGTVCELRTKRGGWGEAEIKYQGRRGICVWLWVRRDGNSEQVEWAESPDKLEFRPIRTPAQIAAYKRETAIRELMDIAQVDCRVTAARLVDAGFKR